MTMHLPSSKNARETDGLICAPLNFPNGEIANNEPLPAKMRPVSSKRRLGEGTIWAMGKSGLKLMTPALKPTKTLNAVPQASAAYSDQFSLANILISQ